MSTPAQFAANTANAQASTGPRTEAGKAISSQNGITHGLFASGDFVRPSDKATYDQLNAELTRELSPAGLLETNLVAEIRRAMWRLRRCGEVESHLAIYLDNGQGFVFDPMETIIPEGEKAQRSVDRARAQAHRLLHKCTAELRKLQTERQCAQALFPEAVDRGIGESRAVEKAQTGRKPSKPAPARNAKLSIVPKSADQPSDFTTRTQSETAKGA